MSKIQPPPIKGLEKQRDVYIYRQFREKKISTASKSALIYKRAFDLFVSSLVILFVLSWLIPILSILIRLDSRGPLFFVQKRVGAFGKIFRCYKLRTMYVNGHAHTRQAGSNDPRITRFGKFLRVSCLDELPQFINVFMGDMSIVGPRPHMLKDCHEFSKLIQDYNDRSVVKPGITGIAQVKGYRGQTNDVYDVVHRFKWDMFYVKNYSFHLDLKIIKATVLSMVSSIFGGLISTKKREKETAVVYNLDSPEYLN
jgi:putative colanic acid biosynthesis UDP-glucose lipid carrier transferase